MLKNTHVFNLVLRYVGKVPHSSNNAAKSYNLRTNNMVQVNEIRNGHHHTVKEMIKYLLGNDTL